MIMTWKGSDTSHHMFPLVLRTGQRYEVEMKRLSPRLLVVVAFDEGGEFTKIRYGSTEKMRRDWRKAV